MKFSKAIVRTPCNEITKGLTTSELGIPNYNKALKQHSKYLEALISLNLEVTILEPDNDFPDSVFVEDTALLIPNCAIITNPGASSRRGEVNEIRDSLGKYYKNIENIKFPGTVDAGDIMAVDSHYYIGLSTRTNEDGVSQLTKILNKYGMKCSTILIKDILHLKSGLAYLEDNKLVIHPEFSNCQEFNKFRLIKVDKDELYAANCVWINGTVLLAKGFPKLKKTIQYQGYNTIELDVSEFRKIDGGLSCLSLRF